MNSLKTLEKNIKEIKFDIKQEKDEEMKDVLNGMLKNFQGIKELIEEYNALPESVRESLPKSTREFFNDKAV